MTWKKELLKKSGLYLVADNGLKENNILNPDFALGTDEDG